MEKYNGYYKILTDRRKEIKNEYRNKFKQEYEEYKNNNTDIDKKELMKTQSQIRKKYNELCKLDEDFKQTKIKTQIIQTYIWKLKNPELTSDQKKRRYLWKKETNKMQNILI